VSHHHRPSAPLQPRLRCGSSSRQDPAVAIYRHRVSSRSSLAGNVEALMQLRRRPSTPSGLMNSPDPQHRKTFCVSVRDVGTSP
jgi:hypothetical protein